jgi:hypothetical protein
VRNEDVRFKVREWRGAPHEEVPITHINELLNQTKEVITHSRGERDVRDKF